MLAILTWQISDALKITLLGFTDEEISIIGKNYSPTVCLHILSSNFAESDLHDLFSSFEQWDSSVQTKIFDYAVRYIARIIDDPNSASQKLKNNLLDSESVNRDEKIDLFIAMMPSLCENSIKEFLTLLNLTDYLKIFDTRSRPKFEINDENEKLLAAFKEANMIDNYDGTMKEPELLPTTFPNILVTPNKGIAVGMASNICSFNLAEICDGTIEVLKNPTVDVERILELVKAPDFAGGGNLIYNRESLTEVYKTGVGSVRLRARYTYDPAANCIDGVEIPYSTSIDAIIKKITDMIKEGKLKEVVDIRDEIDLSGFKLTMDLRRGTDPEQLMNKLYKCTPLEDSFPCNFNVLIDKVPRTMGIIDILKEWITFRIGCVRRELTFDLGKKKEKLHLLLGLGKILLDIDKAIRIIRETKLEKNVVPNLMEGFGIDEVQAEFIAEIKLRHLNREYILGKVKEIEDLQKQIADLEETLSSDQKVKKHIISQLKEIKEKYGIPRKTRIIYEHEIGEYVEDNTVENYPVRLVFTAHGYFKKITMQSLRGNDEQACKEGDRIVLNKDGENTDALLFFSDKGRCYKSRVSDFDTCKASSLGEYVAAKLGFESDERCIFMMDLKEYSEKTNLLFFFENGKGVKVPLSAYETKGARKKLTGAYSAASPIVGILREDESTDFLLFSSDKKGIQLSSTLVPLKTTRTAGGVTLFSLKKNAKLLAVSSDLSLVKEEKSLKKIKIPATGVSLEHFDPEFLKI